MFENVIAEFEEKHITKQEFLHSTIQLMNRQVMSYELLGSNVREKMDIVIENLWNTDSYDEVDMILSIVINLGLKRSYDKIKISMKQEKNINPIILTEMKEAVEETGEHILNPYYSLEKFRNDKHYSGGE